MVSIHTNMCGTKQDAGCELERVGSVRSADTTTVSTALALRSTIVTTVDAQ